MDITRSLQRLAGLVAAVAITLGLVTAPTPSGQTSAESAVVVQHLEVVAVGLETALADVVTGVVNAAKTAVFIVLSPILVPAIAWAFGYRIWGAGMCFAPCNRDADPLWKLSEFIGQVLTALTPAATPAPAAARGTARAAQAVAAVGDPGRSVTESLVSATVVAAPERNGRAAVERPRAEESGAQRRGSRHTINRPAPAATVNADDIESAEPTDSGRGGAKASGTRTVRTATSR